LARRQPCRSRPARPRRGGYGHAARIEEALKGAGLKADLITLDGNSVKARFDTTDNQLKAKDAIQKALIPDPTIRPTWSR
jgi:hypothetical protein